MSFNTSNLRYYVRLNNNTIYVTKIGNLIEEGEGEVLFRNYNFKVVYNYRSFPKLPISKILYHINVLVL